MISPCVHESLDSRPRYIHRYVNPAFSDSLLDLRLLRAGAAFSATAKRHELRGALYAVPRWTRNFLLSHKVRECLRRRSLIRGLRQAALEEAAVRDDLDSRPDYSNSAALVWTDGSGAR